MKTKFHDIAFQASFMMFFLLISTSVFADESYDLTGEWDAVITKTGIYSGTTVANERDTIKISQNADQFVGVRTIGGKFVGKNEEMIKGRLKHKLVDEVFLRYVSHPVTFDLSWIEGRSVITDDGHKMEIQAVVESTTYFETVTLTRMKME